MLQRLSALFPVRYATLALSLGGMLLAIWNLRQWGGSGPPLPVLDW